MDVHAIPVAATAPFRLNVSVGLQLRQDLPHCTLGYPDGLGYLEPDAIWTPSNVDEHESMIR
jgi:hypothetical protein